GGILALLAVPLVYHLVIRRQRLRLDAVFGLMLVLLGVFALSAARAMDASTAIARITVYVVEGVAIYFLVVNVVRSVPTLRRVIATLLLAGSVLGGLALY
ncbi:MAG: hypothetical protein GWN71_44620, partial [Gammaproteobacteria bacterium]|nr:hypothetical protein [Gemmatimonadota bacterium]NIU80374.1 hypothetical protein [Gammaproteobacteria bacterium]NIW77834.1 hypothetical protein [Gemmatimonadota bacterium]